MLTLSPLYNAYSPDGTINLYPAAGSVEENIVNPLTLYRENSWAEQRRRLRTFNSLYGEVEIVDGLKYRLNLGLDFWQERYGSFNSAFTPMVNGVNPNQNNAALRNRETWSYTIENLLTYNKTFGDHTINFTGLFSVQEEESMRSGVNASAIYADYLQFYNFGLAGNVVVPQGNNPFDYYRWGLMSYMGRLNYNFQDRFVATATLRADGSSRLAEGNKWFTYPAGALAWNIGNESFMQNINAINELKLRTGVGITSNQAISPYASLGRLDRRPYNFGYGGGTFGFLVNNLPNANLQWEFTTSYNAGIDFGLFTNRLTGSVDVYQTYTDRVLQNRNLPVTAGVPGSFAQNIGETEGRGVEVMLNGVIVESNRREEFGFTAHVNFTSHRERIRSLAGDIMQDENNGWFVGQPVNVVFDYEKIGIWQLNEAEAADNFGGYRPGDVKVADNNPNGVLDPEDRVILGQLDPKWTAGLTTRFNYRGFDLTAVSFAQGGNMLVSTLYQARAAYPINTLEGRRNGPRVDYWTPDNPTNAFPRTGLQQPEFGSTLGYFDGSFLKIRSINLGYTLSPELLERAGIGSTRVYLSVDNPFKAFFSEYVQEGGIDPEPSGRGNTATPGLGRRLVVTPDTPVTRTIMFGVNVTF
jgi:TonB-linked SusC/RagA family outer membrane protein